MKKFLSLLLVFVLSCSILTGCSDPVYDDFENFLNVEMVGVNANYDKITEEASKWAEYEDIEMLVSSIEDTLIPLVDESLAKLEGIEPETDEVKELKEKYVKVMDAYKEGFEKVLTGINENSEEQIEEGNEKINEGIELLDEYNAGLDALAEEVGAEIE